MLNKYVPLFGSLLLLISCSTKDVSEMKTLRISTPKKIHAHSNLVIRSKHLDAYDSISVELSGKRTKFDSYSDTAIIITDLSSRLSNYDLKVCGYYQGRKYKSNRSTIRVFSKNEPKTLSYELINTFPHDVNAYTQGLKVVGDIFYESTGLYGESDIRKVDIETGKVLEQHEIDPIFFGEGLTTYGDSVFQLTWQKNTGFIYTKDDLKYIGEFRYMHEGWGMDSDDDYIYVSDGTSTIRVWDPKTLGTIFSFNVRDNHTDYRNINELEIVDNYIWANVYTYNHILKIDKTTGEVVGKLDLSNLLSKEDVSPETDVLNGIAYNKTKNTFYVTGKRWPKLFEISINE